MSTSKHIDQICLAALALVLVLTALFWNGEALGLTPAPDGDAESGQFTANDLDGDWDGADAVRIRLTGDGAEADSSRAFVLDGDVHIVSQGRYLLTGSLSNGSVIVDAGSGDKVWLMLDGVSLHCEDSAALVVEQAGKVFLTLAQGSENTVSCGSQYSAEAEKNGIDGAIYSRDDLTINGSGALSVTAAYSHGIVCNDDFVITGGTVQVEAPQDGVHAHDSARLSGMDLTIRAGDDGITVSNDEGTGCFYMESGALSVPSCYEGVEAADVTVAGGTLDLSPTDDGINANGGAESAIRISGGSVRVVNPSGRDADGLDSNGSIFLSGGTVFLSLSGSGGNCALDAGTESGGTCEISGGAVVACGGSMLAEGFSSSSPQGFLMRSVSGDAGTAVALKDGQGAILLQEEIPCSFSSVILSAPGLSLGDACTLVVGDAEESVTIDNTSPSGGFQPGGMPGWTGKGNPWNEEAAAGAGRGKGPRGGIGGSAALPETDPGAQPSEGQDTDTNGNTAREASSSWGTEPAPAKTARSAESPAVLLTAAGNSDPGSAETDSSGAAPNPGGEAPNPGASPGEGNPAAPPGAGTAPADGTEQESGEAADPGAGRMPAETPEFGNFPPMDGPPDWENFPRGQGMDGLAPGAEAEQGAASAPSRDALLLTGLSAAVLLAGLLFAFLFKRR